MKNIILFLIPFVLIACSGNHNKSHSGPLSKGDTIITYSPDSNWLYEEDYDTTTHAPVYFAKNTSRDFVHFHSPDMYGRITLVIRNLNNKNSIYFALNQGEFIPVRDDIVFLSIHLDDNIVKCGGGLFPKSGRKNLVFVDPPRADTILEGIKYAHTLTLSAEFGKNNFTDVRFSLNGLVWNQKAQNTPANIKQGDSLSK